MKPCWCLVLLLTASVSWTADLATRPQLNFTKRFGGSGSDTALAIAVDSAGNSYVTGVTTSTDFPVKNGFQSRMGGTPLRVSTDLGRTWSVPAIPDPVLAVVGSSKTSGLLLAGSTKGIYRSTDSGRSWKPSGIQAASSAPIFVGALIADAQTPSIFYAGTSVGVLQSSDEGATWQLLKHWDQPVAILVGSVGRSPALFAALEQDPLALESAIYRSMNGGQTWELLPNGPSGVLSLACDPVHPDIIYAASASERIDGGGWMFARAVYRSSDAGNTWQKVAELPLAYSTFAMAVSPTAVYAATESGVFLSRDGGNKWSGTSIVDPAANVTVDPANPQVVYADGGGEVLVSVDGGGNWSKVLQVRQYVQTISIVPGSPSTVFVGATPGRNVFVTKWSPDGTQMLYSTYLGGSYDDQPTAIAVDSRGNAYVTGRTASTDFPVTAGVLQTKSAGALNAFVAKIAADGSRLVYGTYLGGSNVDWAAGIVVDRDANVYVTGTAGSPDFPVSNNAAQSRLKQGCSTPPAAGNNWRPNMGDAFVVKLNVDASALSYSTFLGGSCADQGLGITVDSAGAAFVVGTTTSLDFPTTKGAFLPEYGTAAIRGFVARLNPQGSGLSFSTFVGGRGNDTTTTAAVALDVAGNVYLTGMTWGFEQNLFQGQGRTFPDALPGFIGVPVLPDGAAYVLKLDPAGSSRVYVNYIGGRTGLGNGVAVDKAGRAWAAGVTTSGHYGSPVPFPSVHPFQAGIGTGYVAQISADGAGLLFASLMDEPTGLALDSAGNAFLSANLAANVRPSSDEKPLLVRVDGGVAAGVTLEVPQRLPRFMQDGPPSVTNASSPPIFHPVGVSSGEIVVLTGSGLGPTQPVTAMVNPDGSLPVSLGGTSVTFDDVAAGILSVQAEKVLCMAPLSFATGLASATTLQVKRAGERSNSILLPTTGAQVEILGITNGDGTGNSTRNPASAGSAAVIYVAGLGQVPSAATLPGINVSGGGVSLFAINNDTGERTDVDTLYVGQAPGQPTGIIQINFRVPSGPPGIYAVFLGAGTDEDSVWLDVGR